MHFAHEPKFYVQQMNVYSSDVDADDESAPSCKSTGISIKNIPPIAQYEPRCL